MVLLGVSAAAVTVACVLLVLGIWWWFLPPGIGIVLIVGALYVTNIGLDEVFNPKLRKM
jgi:peptide/nickel transport system permease protein